MKSNSNNRSFFFWIELRVYRLNSHSFFSQPPTRTILKKKKSAVQTQFLHIQSFRYWLNVKTFFSMTCFWLRAKRSSYFWVIAENNWLLLAGAMENISTQLTVNSICRVDDDEKKFDVRLYFKNNFLRFKWWNLKIASNFRWSVFTRLTFAEQAES